MSSLPPLMALRRRANTNSKGQFVANVTEGSRKDFLELSSKDELVVSQIASFVVVPSTDGLIHIRSSYTNKYWCSESASSSLLVATAKEPVEDKSAWNCTLFKFQLSSSKVSLYHVGTNSGVVVRPTVGQLLLQVAKSGGGTVEYFEPVDIELIVKLPKRVTFKGNNGKYLRGRYQQRHEYNEFSGEDNLEKATHYEIYYTANGDIRVKSLHYDKYWRRSPNWIWADSTDANSDHPDTLFEVLKVGTNAIALRNRGNQRFCKSLTTEGKYSCLNAATPNVEVDARLEVGEPVIDRKIDVQYRLMDAVFHQKIPLILATSTVPNGTHLDQEITKGITLTKTQVSTWSNTTSLTIGTSTKFNAGVPFIVNGEIEVSIQATNQFEFGQSNDFSKEVRVDYKVTIPPMEKAIIKVLATEAKYDIPFSYTQTDTYSTGERVTTQLDDGVFHCVEAYDFHYETACEPL